MTQRLVCLRFAALNPAQHGAIHAIEQDNHVKPWSAQQLQDCADNGYCAHAWLDAQRTVLGYAVFMPNGLDWELLNITVAKAAQGHGYGALMLAHGVSYARSQGIAAIFLEVRASNAKAISLYQTFKFIQVGLRRGYYATANPAIQEDAQVMKLLLNSHSPLQ